MNKKNKANAIYESKAFLTIVSLLASLAIWLYVSSVETEQIQQTFRGVQVVFTGEDTLGSSKNLVVTDVDTSTITVNITGPRRIIGTLDASDLTAVIDVSNISRASYVSQQYSIVFPDGTDTSKIRVSGKNPETINFAVSAQTSKTIQVRGSFDGVIAEGYTAETPVFEPSTITISGAESVLKDVSYAWVSFGEDNVSSTYEVETGFTLMNAAGDPCSTAGITFSDTVVNAKLPVLILKEVKLGVNIIEGAGATAENTIVRIEPESITLAGDSAVLDGINKIVLDTIDLTQFSSSYTDEYVIPVDNNIKNLTGISTAKVTVQVTGLTTKVFRISNISCINVSDGYEVEILSQSIDVTLRGREDDLGQLKDSSIRAVADLSDYKESNGTYMPVVKIYIDGFTGVGALGENKISVEIRKVS